MCDMDDDLIESNSVSDKDIEDLDNDLDALDVEIPRIFNSDDLSEKGREQFA